MPRHAVFGFSSPATSHSSRKRVLAYGASLTAGYPDCDEPYMKTFVRKCASVGCPVEVVGCGLVGFTAQDMLQHREHRGVSDVVGRTGVGLSKLLLDESADEGPFDVAVLMAGTNDISEGVRDSEAIFKDIASLHEVCHKHGVRTVAVSIPDFWRQHPDQRRSLWEDVNSKLMSWAQTQDDVAHFVDALGVLPYDRCSGAWESDGIHFSEKGSKIFGEAMAEQLLPILGFSSTLTCGASDPDGLEVATDGCETTTSVENGPACGTSVLILLSLPPEGESTSFSEVQKRWVAEVEEAAKKKGHETRLIALQDTTMEAWQDWLCDADTEFFVGVKLVLFCPSAYTDGLQACKVSEEVDDFVLSFIEKVQLLVFILRGLMPEDAQLGLVTPCADSSCSELVCRGITSLCERMSSVEEVTDLVSFSHAKHYEASVSKLLSLK